MITALKDTTTGGWVDAVCDMVAALKDHEIIDSWRHITPEHHCAGQQSCRYLGLENRGILSRVLGVCKGTVQTCLGERLNQG
jgi:hypothetical protein